MQKYLMISESSDKSDLACLMIIIFGLPLWLTWFWQAGDYCIFDSFQTVVYHNGKKLQYLAPKGVAWCVHLQSVKEDNYKATVLQEQTQLFLHVFCQIESG